jgi:carbon monoxide dehydrogenase subunit G
VQIQSSARIEAPLDKVWDLLQDIPRVATCMPGAEITDTVDDHTWKAKVGVKVGPLSVGYNATITRKSLDPVAHSATMQVEAVDGKGRGTVSASIVTSAQSNGDATDIDVLADATVSGMIGQMGQGVLKEVSGRMLKIFAANVAKAVNTPAS